MEHKDSSCRRYGADRDGKEDHASYLLPYGDSQTSAETSERSGSRHEGRFGRTYSGDYRYRFRKVDIRSGSVAWHRQDAYNNAAGEYAVATETRIKFIKTMLDEGMGDRMLFSHDIFSMSTLFDYQPEDILEYIGGICPERFLFIKKRVFGKLAEMGVDPEYLWNLTIENPKRFFEG